MSFEYRQGHLCLCQGNQEIKLNSLGGTPTYFYDLDMIMERVKVFRESWSIPLRIHYAMKANSHPQILKALADQGLGADVVSKGELEQSLAAGMAPTGIVFSGVGKKRNEIEAALGKGIFQLNVESPQELKRIAEIAKAMGLTAPVAFRLNPDVNADTHPYIQTGFRENKFGMDESFLPELIEILKMYPHQLHLQGIAIHIGSQLQDLTPILEATQKALKVFDQLKAQGFRLQTFDVGGGVGLDYRNQNPDSDLPLIQQYGARLSQLLKGRVPQVMCEPGRILVARAGVLLTEVQYVKTTPYRKFVIVDTGMHHLMRPALYQAHHEVSPLTEPGNQDLQLFDIVGPICESTDVLARDRRLPLLQSGDRLGIRDVGAYGFAMANHYNAHDLPSEVVYANGKALGVNT
jgi:diaminopimelate decarboxylase